jgi:hypothetical protein
LSSRKIAVGRVFMREEDGGDIESGSGNFLEELDEENRERGLKG